MMMPFGLKQPVMNPANRCGGGLMNQWGKGDPVNLSRFTENYTRRKRNSSSK